ncbi:MAG TPA: hypothetical protein VFJ43_09340, partial [Bacteroidia bacterium]|nr:hypothetical protein [Bacteroidia bacterium]
MKQFKKPLKKLFIVASLLFAGFTTTHAQVTVVATAGNMGPVVYPDLNSAFAAINAGTHQGAIGVGIGASTTETGPCVLNSSGAGAAVYTSVAINPIVDGVTVSCATATGRGVIELNGADNVTIDGDNPNSPGTNRNLTITNTAANTIAYTSVVRIALSTLITSGDNDIVRNCILNGSATGRNTAAANSTVGSEHTTYGILVGGGASTVTNTTAPSAIASVSTTIGAGITAASFTADNNAITACARGIAVQGSAVTVANLMTITNNVIGSATANNPTTVYSRGMTLQGFNNATISGNTIQNMDWYVATACMAIGLGEVSSSGTNAIVEKNIINHVWNRNTGTFGSYGINLAAGATITVRNNFIADISHDMTGGGAFSGTFGVFGIRVNTGTGHVIDYNSVNLFGVMPGTAGTTMLSAALGILNTGLTGIDCRNNILSNTLSGGTTSIANVSLFIPSGGTSAMNLTLNNNIYYSGSSATTQGIAQAGTTAGTGFYLASNFNPVATTPASNLRSYTSTLSATGTNDNASFASTVIAPFVSTTDLHINNLAANAPDADGKAAVIASITTDIDGATRNATTPDIGADEFVLPNCAGANGGTITPATQSVCAGSTTTMTSTGATTGTGISYQWMVSTVSGGPYSNVSGGSGATTASYTTAALTTGTYYYVLQTTCSFGPLTGLSNELTVTVNPSPTVTVTPNSGSICQPGGSPVTLTASGATTYSWLPVAGLSSPTVANPTANPASTTTYTVTGTTAGCTATAT